MHGDAIAAIPALALASGAGLWLGVRRQRPDWASLASIGVQLTIAIALQRSFQPQPFGDWAAYLWQSVVAGAGLLALLGRWLRDRRGSGLNIFLLLQLAIIGGGLLTLFGPPVFELVGDPASPPSQFALESGKWSGLGSLLITAAALWLLARRNAPTLCDHIICGFGLPASMWIALAVERFRPGWPSYHALLASYALAGLFAAAIANRASMSWAPIFALLAAALGLAVAWDDPHTPYTSAAATIVAATTFATLAIRGRSLVSIWMSAAMLNLSGWSVWLAWGGSGLVDFMAMPIAACAISAVIWQLLDPRLSRSFREIVVAVGAGLLAICAGFDMAQLLEPQIHQSADFTIWIASVLAAAAALLGLMAPPLRSAPISLYVIGFASVLLAWLELHGPDARWLRPALVSIAGYLLLAQIVEATWPRRQRTTAGWFAAAQMAAATVVIAL